MRISGWSSDVCSSDRFRDDLWRKNGFGRLRVEVDDHAFSHALEPPACGDPVELSLGILPVRSCGNDGGIRPTLDPPQNRIIASDEHLLHRATHVGEVFGTAEQISSPCRTAEKTADIQSI